MGHWRKNHEGDSNHLKSADLFDEKSSAPNKPVYFSPVVLIEKATTDRVKSREKPKGDRRNFVHFKGKGKPLGLNVTNCETLESLSGSPDPAHWVGLTIQLYVDPEAKYPSGKRGPAIRIRPTLPRGATPDDTSPLPDVSDAERARLEAEHAARIDDDRQPWQEG